MLAVQVIKIEWRKDCRGPEFSAARRELAKPKTLDAEQLCGSGIFVNRNSYIQTKDGIFSRKKLAEERLKNEGFKIVRRHIISSPETAEYAFFNTPDEVRINSVRIIPEEDGYRIRWQYDRNPRPSRMPIRRGRNEEFNDSASPFAGMNLLNETAFVLHSGESGKMMYNYRLSEDECGHSYELYSVYFVNTEKLEADTFTKAEYGSEYSQMAKLF